MKYIIYILLFALPSVSFAQDKSQWEKKFDNANSLYIKENYAKAIEIYHELIQEKDNSPEVFFNLANAYYKLNNNTDAIYYYEKALKLAPDTQAFLTNLNYARKNLEDDITIVKEYDQQDIIHQSLGILTVNQWATLSTLAAFLVLICFICYYLTTKSNVKKLSFTCLILFLFLSLVTAYSAYFEDHYKSDAYSGIIFDKVLELKSEARHTSDTIRELHEGTRVHVLEEKSLWIKVQLDNQEEGWIEKKSIKVI
ncbi:tetratricopeptide repeat protein [Myroides sp. BIT-d1]|uniref:Tetratricopeptide repeat protein n=2 Tax=Flavobacteriaceae TaxID=49546 RepID=A0A6I3LI43_9FLAO|nr:tetratricopeptide repeat protein [Myroides albus]MVX37309.1 tetratricopeptide repeat protein [Myroides sp. LoEW2-1]